MSEKYIYTIADLTKKHGQKEVLKNIWLSFYPGAKIGVLGKNGAGKSTLLRIMAGGDKDFEGEARIAEGYTAGYLSQEPRLDPAKTVQGNVDDAVGHVRAILARYDEINARLGDPIDADEMEKLLAEQAKVQDQIELHNAWELDRQIEIAMDAMNLPPGDADVTKLSGGERRRVALCKILLEKPDLLLLDEPTNHLDAESVNWLERHLAEYTGTVVAVTHDRYFLDNVAKWILELDRGRGIPWEGNYSSWLEQKKARLVVEEKQASARQKTLERELEWIRLAPRARQAKSKARINAYEQLSKQSFEEREQEFEIQIPPGKHLGGLVVEMKNVSKGYGDQVLMENLSFRLPPGGIVGVIGPNGAGKTTLFRMITGEEKPDKGRSENRRHGGVGLRRSKSRCPHRRKNRVRRNLRRHRRAGVGRPENQFACVLGTFQFHRTRSAKKSRRPLRRRTQPRAPGETVAPRLQLVVARRADERSRRRHPAGS